MISFKEYLSLDEEFDRFKLYDLSNPNTAEVGKIDNLDVLEATIRKNCSSTLKAYQQSHRVLFRGVKKAKEFAFVTGVRDNRRAVEMPAKAHRLLTQAFKMHGLKVNRSNCLFTSPKDYIADSWGNIYIIFMRDGWTAQVYDNSKSDYSFSVLQNAAMDDGSYDPKYGGYPNIFKALEDLGVREFTDVGALTTVLKQGYCEVLLLGDSYIGIRANKSGLEFMKRLGIHIQQ